MKTIIRGRRYDTETAICLGEASSGGSVSDFRYWEAGLYKTKKIGQFFLAGEGGPMTQFATRHTDGSRSSGSRIIILDTPQALEWAEEHLDLATIEQHFKIEDA